jgi:hypothetical protein
MLIPAIARGPSLCDFEPDPQLQGFGKMGIIQRLPHDLRR